MPLLGANFLSTLFRTQVPLVVMLLSLAALHAWLVAGPMDRMHVFQLLVILLLIAILFYDRKRPVVVPPTAAATEYVPSASELVHSEDDEEEVDLSMTLDPSAVTAIPHLVDQFFRLALSDADWDYITQVDSVTIHKGPKLSDFAFKVRGTIDQTPATVFDLLTDVPSRPNWDEMVVESKLIQQIDACTRVVYIRVKPIWPTASRDMVLLSHLRVMEMDVPVDTATGRLERKKVYLNVTKSVVHPMMSERTDEGFVRMQMGLAGQLLYAVEVEGRVQTRVIQLADTNPNGWIPSSVVSFVATKAVPNAFFKLNKVVQSKPRIERCSFEAAGDAGNESVNGSVNDNGSVKPDSIKSDSKVSSALTTPSTTPVKRPSSETSMRKRKTGKRRTSSTQTESGLTATNALVGRRTSLQVVQEHAEVAMPWMVAAVLGITVTNVALRYMRS